MAKALTVPAAKPEPGPRRSRRGPGSLLRETQPLYFELPPFGVSSVCSGSSGCGNAWTARFQLFSVNVTFFAPGFWIAPVCAPLPSSVVCASVLLTGTGAGLAAVEGRKLTLPVVWPSARIWIGQAWSGPGFGAVQMPWPLKAITTELTSALVAKELNAVGM